MTIRRLLSSTATTAHANAAQRWFTSSTTTAASAQRLSRSTLSSLQGGKVELPNYDPSQVTPGILHLGVGNFHRSHFGTYMDDALQADFQGHQQWGIVGAGILPSDVDKRACLEKQDWLQTLVEKDGSSKKAKIIASMVDYLEVLPENANHSALRDKMLDPNIKIASMTVTEGGYFLNDGAFDPHHPLIKHDIEHPDDPHTIFGMMVFALKQRRDSGLKPFSIMSNDNIPHNGKVVKSVVVGLAKEIDAELAKWIESNVAFPNSMVDRITPATSSEQIASIEMDYGYQDEWPIICEPFRQWVIEDSFSNGRPAWDKCDNVTFVPDVAPYETMKLRILNGGHASLCYPSALLGVNYVHEAMEHKTIGPFLDTLERNEIIPTVPPVPNTNLTKYWNIIEERFSNPVLQDTIARNCFDGANRQPKFIVPVIADALAKKSGVEGLALVSAMWSRYCHGTTEAGETIESNVSCGCSGWHCVHCSRGMRKESP